MAKIAFLRIFEGSFERGFPAELVIIDTQTGARTPIKQGSLPPATTLHNHQTDFYNTQTQWGRIYYWWRNRPIDLPQRIELAADPLTTQAINTLEIIRSNLDDWLLSRSFQKIRDEIIANISSLDGLIIDTESFDLQRLPWKRWDVIRNNDKIQVALHRNNIQCQTHELSWPVKILAILGSDIDIDLTVDEAFIKNLPGAETTILRQPRAERLYQAIQSNSWDILWFSGHSVTQEDGTDARLYINSYEPPLTIDDLSSDLRDAVEKGLKLIVFNSCDGLGIPHRLADLEIHVPYVVVMIEPIHDKLAHKFLEFFLKYFTKRNSLQQAFQKACRDLRRYKNQFPNADYLPVLFHHFENPSLFYPKLNFLDRLELAIRAGIERLQLPLPSLKLIRLALLFLVALLTCLIIYFIKNTISPVENPPNPAVSTTSPNSFSPTDPQAIADLCPRTSNLLSCGDKNIINYPRGSQLLPQELQGIVELAKSYNEIDYEKAIKFLNKAWKEQKDPAVLIALNNAKVFQNLQKGDITKDNVFTIAVVIPFENYEKNIAEFIGKNILTGVAWRQEQINNDETSKLKFIVLMANDSNNQGQGKKIASELSQLKDLIGVVAPYSSHVTFSVINEYKNAGLSLISPCSTATLESFEKQGIKDFSYFFRPVSTTDIAAEHLISYLKTQYEKFIVIYKAEDLFSESYYNSFKTSLNNEKLIVDVNLKNLDDKKITIKDKIEEIKRKYSPETTILILISNAYTDQSTQQKKLDVIQLNNGHFPIVENNTVYDPDVLKRPAQEIKDMIVTVPYFLSNSDAQMEEFQQVFGETEELTWHGVMGYDSTQMFFEAISRTRKINLDQKPIREYIKDVLNNTYGKFETTGITGKITLQENDRVEQVNFLISPDCSSGSCQWREVERYP